MTSKTSETTAAAPSSPWRLAPFRRLWFSTVILALANQCERLAVGWLVLMETDSVFLTAASFAAQKAPLSLVAPVAGHICDRLPRSRVLAATALYKAVIVALIASLTLDGVDHVWIVFILVALTGVGASFDIPATQGLITDTVPPQMAMKAVAMQSIGARAVGAMGSLVGGLAITTFGISTALFTGACVYLIGAAVIATMPRNQSRREVSGGVGSGILLEAAKGLMALLRLPVVRILLLMAFIAEVFAFSYGAVLPSMARDVLHVDADGLGTLTLMAGFGAVIGVAVLTAIGSSSRKGLLLIGIAMAYGLTLTVFASSGIFLLSLFLIMGVGASAAMFDAMQWTLLQQHVPDDMRGRAIGGWVFFIGFGWIGNLALGAVAQAVGVQWALGGAGVLLVLTGLVVYGSSPRLRAA